MGPNTNPQRGGRDREENGGNEEELRVPSDHLNSKLSRAAELFAKLQHQSGITAGILSCLTALGQGKTVTDLAWESLKSVIESAPVGDDREPLLEVIQLFYQGAEQGGVEAQVSPRVASLPLPFRSFLEAMKERVDWSTTFHSLEVGVNDLPMDEFRREMLAGDCSDFRDSLLVIRDQMDPEIVDREPPLGALHTLITRRATAAACTAAFLSLTEKDFSEEDLPTGKISEEEFFKERLRSKNLVAYLNMDFSDRAYEVSLNNRDLPPEFVNQLLGPEAAIPDIRMERVEARLPELAPGLLHEYQVRFVEIMRDTGIELSGSGWELHIKDRPALASFSPDHIERTLDKRLGSLEQLQLELSRSTYCHSPEGETLSQALDVLIEGQEISLKMLNADSESEYQNLRRQSRQKCEELFSTMASPEFSDYLASVFQCCCKNKIPVFARSLDDI